MFVFSPSIASKGPFSRRLSGASPLQWPSLASPVLTDFSLVRAHLSFLLASILRRQVDDVEALYRLADQELSSEEFLHRE